MTMAAESVEQLLASHLAEARTGSAAAAALTAMLIHKYPREAAEAGIRTQYDWLLSQALQSKDAELVVCVGEELMAGKRLAHDSSRAMSFFSRADDLSSFMGSFVLGRMLLAQHPKEALPYLQRAREAGHIPSAVLENHARSQAIPVLGWFSKRLFGLRIMVQCWRAIHSDQSARLMWRYKDVFPDTSGAMAEKMSIDRRQPLPLLKALNEPSES